VLTTCGACGKLQEAARRGGWVPGCQGARVPGCQGARVGQLDMERVPRFLGSSVPRLGIVIDLEDADHSPSWDGKPA